MAEREWSQREWDDQLKRAVEGSRDEVLELLADRHGEMRLAAVRGLLSRFPEDAAAVYPLLFDSAEVNVGTGGCVPARLQPLGEVVLELLTRASALEPVRSTLEGALRDTRLGRRRYGYLLAASGRRLPRLQSAVGLALEAVRDDDADVRHDAAAMLGHATLEEIAAFAVDADPRVREAAARALGYRATSESEACAWLARLSQDPERSVRESVAQSLGRWSSDPAGQAALVRLAGDQDEGVRVAAVTRLGAVVPAPERALVGAGRDPSPRVRAAAIEGLLAVRSETAIGLVLEIVEREECPPIRAAKALKKLAATRDAQVLAFARRLVAGCPDAITEYEQRCMPVAISIIGAHGSGSDLGALAPHLTSRFDEVAIAAERASRRLSGVAR